MQRTSFFLNLRNLDRHIALFIHLHNFDYFNIYIPDYHEFMFGKIPARSIYFRFLKRKWNTLNVEGFLGLLYVAQVVSLLTMICSRYSRNFTGKSLNKTFLKTKLSFD